MRLWPKSFRNRLRMGRNWLCSTKLSMWFGGFCNQTGPSSCTLLSRQLPWTCSRIAWRATELVSLGSSVQATSIFYNTWEVCLAVFVLGELFHLWGSVLSPTIPTQSELKDQDHFGFPREQIPHLWKVPAQLWKRKQSFGVLFQDKSLDSFYMRITHFLWSLRLGELLGHLGWALALSRQFGIRQVSLSLYDSSFVCTMGSIALPWGRRSLYLVSSPLNCLGAS